MHMRIAVACAAAFGVLAILVAHGGVVHRIDAYAVHHLMPGLQPSTRAPTMAGSIVPLRHASVGNGPSRVRFAANVWTFPASAGVSALLFAVGCLLLLRRGRRTAAVVWATLWVAGNAIEVLCKTVIERPPLYGFVHGVPVHLAGFDNSYPSGHTLRSILLAALVIALWARLRPAALVWAAVALPLLLVAGFHTPSDIVGGALLAGFLLALAAATATRRRSASR